jgi:hypothetical protein
MIDKDWRQRVIADSDITVSVNSSRRCNGRGYTEPLRLNFGTGKQNKRQKQDKNGFSRDCKFFGLFFNYVKASNIEHFFELNILICNIFYSFRNREIQFS